MIPELAFEMERAAPARGFSEAARAYAASAGMRNLREQEAEVFRRANLALRRARAAGGPARTRALAELVQMWNIVTDLLSDPDNALPPELRAAIISVGMVVRREAQSDDPDFDFLIAVNENIAAGLSETA